MLVLQLANNHPEVLSQMGITKEQIEQMIDKSEKDKEITRMSQEERTLQNNNLWMEWLKKFRYVIRIE